MEFGCDIPYLKGKGVPMHYMKAYMGFEDSSTPSTWNYPDDSSQPHAFASLLLGEGLSPSLHLSSRRLAGPESQSKNFREEINHLQISGTGTTLCPGFSLITTQTVQAPSGKCDWSVPTVYLGEPLERLPTLI
jgi:hypothetical protein